VGTARSRRWRRSGCDDGEQRRKAVRADGSAARQGGERSARSVERWRGAGVACGAQRGGAEQLKLGTWPAKATGRRAERRQNRAEQGGWR
jgi:hypothetical protein